MTALIWGNRGKVRRWFALRPDGGSYRICEYRTGRRSQSFDVHFHKTSTARGEKIGAHPWLGDAQRLAQDHLDREAFDINGARLQVGDKVRRATWGSDVIPIERRTLLGEVVGVGDRAPMLGCIQVTFSIGWASSTSFEKVTS